MFIAKNLPNSLIIAAAGFLLLSAGCSQPPTQITINANSSADKTDTYTETNTLQAESNLTATSNSRNSTVLAPIPQVAPVVATTSIPAATPTTTASFGTCTWNGASERCRAEWTGQLATVTWLSDNKVTRYDFSSKTVFDSSNGKTYPAIVSDYNSGCISTANGSTCIYR